MLETLKEQVCRANLLLVEYKLVISTWGKDAVAAVEAAVTLDEVARMAQGTVVLSPQQKPIPQTLLDKHFLRKHGKNAYYGQN